MRMRLRRLHKSMEVDISNSYLQYVGSSHISDELNAALRGDQIVHDRHYAPKARFVL